MNRNSILLLLLIFAMVLVACGGTATQTNNAEPADTINEDTNAENVLEEETPTGNTIVDIAADDDRFDTLVSAVNAAGLAETLAGEGQFTVFAPTDDAFAALPEGTLDTLLADADGALTDVLLYHVLDEAVPAETVVTLDSATTLLGEDITITTSDGNVFLNENVQVVATDIEAANGIIHVVDAVLVPAG